MDGLGRMWLLIAVAILAGAGGASYWLAATAPTPPPQPNPQAITDQSPPPAPVPAAVPQPAAPPPPASVAPAIVVDSAERTYPLTAWRIGQTTGGWVDALRDAGAPLSDGDIIELSGWAGDSELGWRARNVVIAVCGQVVASVRVDLPRADVARAAHPNLGVSGWRAKVAVAHLPRCESPQIQAIAQLGAGQLALPLQGNRPLMLRPAGGSRPNLLAPPAPVSPPVNDPELRSLRLSGNANVRRCAGMQCEQRGLLPAGTHRAIIAEESGEWMLVSVPALNLAGWISRRTLAASSGR